MLDATDATPIASPEDAAFADALIQLDAYPLATQLDFALFVLAKARSNNDWQLVDDAMVALAVAAKNAENNA